MKSELRQPVEEYIAKSMEDVWRVPHLSSDVSAHPIEKVAVIGAGTMGRGIAMCFANANLPVKIIEKKPDKLEYGLKVINCHYQRSAQKGRISVQEVNKRMKRLSGALTLEKLSDSDLIIEAVYEEMDLKKQIFSCVDKLARPGAILATNTSALDIDEIASATARPQDVIGLHFFSPANVMKLLEIVRAEKSADEVVFSAMSVAKKIKKIPVLVGVCSGFVGNRILYARQDQGQKLLFKGVMPWDIDAAMKSFGFKMGNFQMSDLAGLDIGWAKGKKTHNPIRDALCEMDRRGQKTRAGYYDYDDKRNPKPSKISERIIYEITGMKPIKMPNRDIIETCIYPMINEAVKILEENKVQRPSDIDVIWRNGYGWPAQTGGPMYYADIIGAERILAKMEELGAEDPKYEPSKMLKKLVVSGKNFSEIDTGGLKTARFSGNSDDI